MKFSYGQWPKKNTSTLRHKSTSRAKLCHSCRCQYQVYISNSFVQLKRGHPKPRQPTMFQASSRLIHRSCRRFTTWETHCPTLVNTTTAMHGVCHTNPPRAHCRTKQHPECNVHLVPNLLMHCTMTCPKQSNWINHHAEILQPIFQACVSITQHMLMEETCPGNCLGAVASI